MFTPQQIEQIAFSRATFGGYDMQSVDEFLEPLTEDYITLYKENALLKSKMRVLVGKLEEYRKNEASMKDAIINAQKTCDMMVKEAETKCTQMLTDANSMATENAKNAEALIAEESARVEEARRVAAQQIDELESQIRNCLDTLEQIKQANRPVAKASPAMYDFDNEADEDVPEVDPTDAMADEIASNLEALVGPTAEVGPTPEPQHPVSSTSSKFGDLRSHFGQEYNPTRK